MDATPSLEILDLYLHLTEFGGKNRFRSNYNKKFSINSFKFKWVKMKYNLKFSSSVTLPPYKCTGLHVACIYQQALGSWTRKCDGSRTSGDERGEGASGERSLRPHMPLLLGLVKLLLAEPSPEGVPHSACPLQTLLRSDNTAYSLAGLCVSKGRLFHSSGAFCWSVGWNFVISISTFEEGFTNSWRGKILIFFSPLSKILCHNNGI